MPFRLHMRTRFFEAPQPSVKITAFVAPNFLAAAMAGRHRKCHHPEWVEIPCD
jgi:hypothetical protein